MPSDNQARYVTGSDLLTGEVVFLASDGRWVVDLSDAEVIADAEVNATRLRDAELYASQVVGPYLADAKTDATRPTPAHFRERFRAKGPSNYPHGKQERQRHV